MTWMSFRRKWLTAPVFNLARKALPAMSDTEKEAIEAGDVWWEADLFSGAPNWNQLLEMPAASLTPEEQGFIDGPVQELIQMLDEWHITQVEGDLPEAAWEHIKHAGFFGMIIPKEYGGLGFSAYAHSEVVKLLSMHSITAAVTVMVPNSLGPGELLLQYGTPEQRQHWLPRLAAGTEVPCFGLTSPEAGSDAAAMIDTGVVVKQWVDGQEVLGIRLNFNKRYITLSPVATVLGLAFKLFDPDHLLSDQEEVGITVALVPADTPGVTTGRRHLPAMQVFQNGPMQGQDVFVPLDAIIGGAEMAGKGWQMLMGALAAGRGISLPSLSAAACVFTAHTAGAYARVRTQFGIPIGSFEGVQERLAHLAANAYEVEAARRFTCSGLMQGVKPSVVSAIMKLHCTEKMRESVNDAMDIHAGKAVIDGPSNYLSHLHRSVPVAITVEGANILTRSLIVFGQGAIRAHPWLKQEMTALANSDQREACQQFDGLIWRHASHSLKNVFRAAFLSWTNGAFVRVPRRAGVSASYFKRLSRCAAVFAVVAEASLFSLGGQLKRREMLSARLGDMLSELFLLSAVLKRWHDEQKLSADLPLLQVVMQRSLHRFDLQLKAVLDNLPLRPLAWFLRVLVRPLGLSAPMPRDVLLSEVAELLLSPSSTRERLTGVSGQHNHLKLLNQAFALASTAQPLMLRLRKEGYDDWEQAVREGAITEEEKALLQSYQALVDQVIAVDDFEADAFKREARS